MLSVKNFGRKSERRCDKKHAKYQWFWHKIQKKAKNWLKSIFNHEGGTQKFRVTAQKSHINKLSDDIKRNSSDKYRKMAQKNNNIAIARPNFVWGPGLLNMIFSSYKNICACKKSAPFDPVWPYLAPCGPIWPCLPRLALFDPVWPHLAPFGPIWSCLVPLGPIWSHLAQFGPICPAWLRLDTF